MLGKLIKYELKSYYLFNVIVWAALITCSILLGLCVRVSNNTELVSFTVFTVLLGIGVYALAVATIVLFFVTTICSTYLRMFSDFGVLNFSLPVKADTMIISKYISCSIWFFGAVISCILALVFGGILSLNASGLLSIIQGLFDNFGEFIVSFIFIILKMFYIYTMLLTAFILMNSGFVKRAKFIAAFGVFVVVNIVCTYLSRIVLIIPFEISFNNGVIGIAKLAFGEGGLYSFNALLFNAILTIGGIFLNRYLLSNKLELQ